MSLLNQDFFVRESEVVAIELVGHFLVFERSPRAKMVGMVVETEAYYGSEDPASHAYRKKTSRNAIMFGPAGVSYVYFTYGSCYLLNVVTRKEGLAGAVLIRALEPLEGIEYMQKSRRTTEIADLTSGPGKLTQAMGITKEHNGLGMVEGPLRFEENKSMPDILTIRAGKRVGISQGKEFLYRFCLKDNPYVSSK